MKFLPTLSILLLLTMSLSSLARKCPVKPPVVNPNDSDSQEESGETSTDDRIPIGQEYTENVNYQGDGEPPVGETIPVGFGEIVPAFYQSGNSSVVSSLLVGAQFVAEHAVLKGLFSNSNHKISQVFSRRFSHLTSITEFGEELVDLGNDKYDYDVEIISSNDEKIRAQFSVETSVYDNTDSFYMDSFSFTYNALVNGESQVLELSWTRTDAETENFKYRLAAANAEDPNTKVITEDNLPTLGETVTLNEFLVQENWSEINEDEITGDDNLNYIYQVGYTFVSFQIQSLPISSSLFDADHIIGVYKQEVDGNVVNYRFNVLSGEYLTETANINFEIAYNQAENSYYIYSWSVMTHVIPLIL